MRTIRTRTSGAMGTASQAGAALSTIFWLKGKPKKPPRRNLSTPSPEKPSTPSPAPKPTTIFLTEVCIFPGSVFSATQKSVQRNPSRSLDGLQRRRQPREKEPANFRKLHRKQAEHWNRAGRDEFPPEIPAKFSGVGGRQSAENRVAMHFRINKTHDRAHGHEQRHCQHLQRRMRLLLCRRR